MARGSSVRAIGFAGSGKYPEAAGACEETDILFAVSAEKLEQIILEE